MDNILWFVLLVSAAAVVLAILADVGSQIWAEKLAERQAKWAKFREAESLLRGAIVKRYHSGSNAKHVAELKVVELPKKSDGGRHRLSAA